MIAKSKWGTRQAAPTLDGIRDDHLARYRYAGKFAATLESGVGTVADVGCGTGYGAYLMAVEFKLKVYAYEIDPEAISFGELHYTHPYVIRQNEDIADIEIPAVDVITAFEILEHFDGAAAFLQKASRRARCLVGSVPNQDLVPFDAELHGKWHVRHYTPGEIIATLEAAGWHVVVIGCQAGKHGPDGQIVWDHTNGRTIVFVAVS